MFIWSIVFLIPTKGLSNYSIYSSKFKFFSSFSADWPEKKDPAPALEIRKDVFGK